MFAFRAGACPLPRISGRGKSTLLTYGLLCPAVMEHLEKSKRKTAPNSDLFSWARHRKDRSDLLVVTLVGKTSRSTPGTYLKVSMKAGSSTRNCRYRECAGIPPADFHSNAEGGLAKAQRPGPRWGTTGMNFPAGSVGAVRGLCDGAVTIHKHARSSTRKSLATGWRTIA